MSCAQTESESDPDNTDNLEGIPHKEESLGLIYKVDDFPPFSTRKANGLVWMNAVSEAVIT